MTARSKPTDERIRAFVRPKLKAPAAPQIRACIEAGAGAVYVLDKQKPMIERDGARIYQGLDAHSLWLRSLSPGCTAIVTTIGRAAETRQAIADVIERVHAAGAVLVEASTGRRSDDLAALPQLMADAFDELAGKRGWFTPARGREAGAKAVRANADRMPVKQARAIWRDAKGYPKRREALAAMYGWTDRTAYYVFGPRYNDPSRGGRPRTKI